MLIKECTRAMDMVARLDHSEAQHWLATDRALASEEQARVIEECARTESDRARAAKDQVKAIEAQAKAA